MGTVHSFDVFDTVLTRRVGAPEVVVDLLSRRLEGEGRIPVPAAVFGAARRRYERYLNRDLGRHATLREIYHAVAAALSVDPAGAEGWAGAEERLERELCIAVPGASELVREARSRADHVVFVSDTPHRQSFVRELLERAGLAGEQDAVFVSSEWPVSKARGGLFHAVRAVVGAEHHYWHVGDNPRNDVAAARVEGWSSTVAPGGRLSRYERLLEEHATDTDLLTSWLAGSSRLARLEGQGREVPRPVAEVASGVLAPMLVGYALWTVAQARLLGVRRLYYVARDGRVMLDAARHVIGALAPDLELRYLYGSRQPWTLGASATSQDTLRRWVTAKPDSTPRTVLTRVDLTPERVADLTGLPLAGPARCDTALSASERLELADALLEEPLRGLVMEAASRAAEQSTAYLRQEGLLDGVPSALVDAGWGGSTAKAFDHLLVQAGGAPVPHLVVGVIGSEADAHLRDGVTLVPWLFNGDRRPHQLTGFPAPNTLVEMFCADTVGRTLGYETRDGRVHPVLEKQTNVPVVDWGLPQMQQVAVRVAELVAPRLSTHVVNVDSTACVWDVLRAFWTDPTPAEARVWGSFPWEEEMWPPYVPIAERISAVDIAGRALRGEKQKIRRRNSWRAGSAMVSAQPWRTLLTLRTWQDDNRARLGRIPRRLRLEVAARRRG